MHIMGGLAMVDNIRPRDTWDALARDAKAVLIDVRTDAEWLYVGMPDLSDIDKDPLLIAWQVFPAMQLNSVFITQMKAAGLTPEHRIYFICRSGVRSLAAAEAAREAGYDHVYNVADGFEGPPDEAGHRGRRAGWKVEGLPWRQR